MHTALLAVWLLTAAAAPTRPDSTLTAAREALVAGRAWQATRILAPLLADSTRRTPEVVLVAATAAARWSGWAEVHSLLADEPWLDSLFAGEGRRLLARAALERHADSLALRSALRGLRTDSTSADLLVVLAQALERLDARDSAAAVYQRAANRLPTIADWLRLRAAAVTDDSTRRDALVAQLADPLTRSRAPWSVAAARERAGDFAGAARDYAALGAPVRALKLRLTASLDSALYRSIRQDLVVLIGTRPAPADLREAIALLDSAFASLSAAEQLTVARSAGRALPARALEGYRAALAAGLGTSQDRFDYAATLFRLDRYSDAAFQFNLVRQPRALAASAAYQRGRALVRDGQLSEAHAALLDVVRQYPRDTAAAAALFLLADLATDRQDEVEARQLLRRAALQYPSSGFAPAARFRAAILAFTAGQYGRSAREFDELARRYPTNGEAVAAVYWAGRAFAAAGDTTAAVSRWEKAAGGDALSYYASLAARRLGRAPWMPMAAADTFIAVPDVDSVLERAALLERLGLAAEARLEYRRLTNLGPDVGSEAAERLLAAANAFRAAGRATDGVGLARRALSRGAVPDARTYRLLFPVIHREALAAEAMAQQLDPSFVAALIRQESRFDPAARSGAGARGLMQIMPSVGARVAQALDYPVWDPVLLYQPEVSLQLGVRHLRELSDRYDAPVRILAAYNAGASRVDRWRQKRGADDPELFAEQIPYVETRDYVRIIQRNQEIYRAIYQ